MSMQQAPDFTLDHVAGRKVSLSDYRGRPVVLMFNGRDSADEANQVGEAIRGIYGPDEVAMIGVPDMHGVPRLMQGMAKGRLQSAYEKSAKTVSEGLKANGKTVPADLSQLVVIAPDWDGKVTSSYGLRGTDKQAVAIVLDATGAVRGRATGSTIGQQVLNLLAETAK
jgi:hypothetical protein